MSEITLTNIEIRYLVRIAYIADGKPGNYVNVNVLYIKRNSRCLNVIKCLRSKGLIDVRTDKSIIKYVALTNRCNFLVGI